MREQRRTHPIIGGRTTTTARHARTTLAPACD
jgi:hypothetical protein